MYEKTNFLCLTMQRYAEKLSGQNPFNESGDVFSESVDLYFVSNCITFVSTSLVRGRNSIGRQ